MAGVEIPYHCVSCHVFYANILVFRGICKVLKVLQLLVISDTCPSDCIDITYHSLRCVLCVVRLFGVPLILMGWFGAIFFVDGCMTTTADCVLYNFCFSVRKSNPSIVDYLLRIRPN